MCVNLCAFVCLCMSISVRLRDCVCLKVSLSVCVSWICFSVIVFSSCDSPTSQGVTTHFSSHFTLGFARFTRRTLCATRLQFSAF